MAEVDYTDSVTPDEVLPALSREDIPQSPVPALHERCQSVVAWANSTDDVEQINEARLYVNAVEEYLSAKKAEGPAQTAARLLEARIGEVLGPADNRGPATLHRDVRLTHHEKYDFRRLAENRDIWEPRLPLARKRALRLIRDDEADMRPEIDIPTETMMDVRFGDFREVLRDVPDESVDLILTDPPYPGEFLPLWTDLAVFAKQKLTPSGVLAAMSGQFHLPEVMTRLGQHLNYRWTMAYVMAGAANVVHARRVSTQWKPILVYGSSDRRLHDVATSTMADKDFHGWGQSESGTLALLQLLTDPGAVVCDPFLGGGTTAVAAAAHHCHFIGAEIDEEAYRVAKGRL